MSGDDWARLTERAAVLDPATRELLARRWGEAALGEHASIGSFAQFTLQLLAVGAPPELLTQAHRAGLDEVEHARVSFRIASIFAGAPLGPGPLPLPRAMPDTSLLGAATATLLEGCIAETLSAHEAQQAAEWATEPTVAAALTRIAEDEARHAELAYAFVGWALQVGGPGLVEPLRAAARDHLAAYERPPGPADAEPDLRAWGVVGVAERRRLHRAALDALVRPALDAVLGR